MDENKKRKQKKIDKAIDMTFRRAIPRPMARRRLPSPLVVQSTAKRPRSPKRKSTMPAAARVTNISRGGDRWTTANP
jgi:hypothetical protein